MPCQPKAIAVLNLLFFQACCFNGLLATMPNDNKIQLCKEVTVDDGQDQVKLPCFYQKITKNRGTILWRVGSDNENDKEVLTLNSNDNLTMGKGYEDRVEISGTSCIESTGNISLILKRPMINDTGLYHCTTTDQQSISVKVKLRVIDTCTRTSNITANQGNHSVKLPCEKCVQVVNDTTTWRKLESGSEGRCIFRRGPDGTNKYCDDKYERRVNLGSKHSLVLSSPTVADTGNYSCTIESQCSNITTYVQLTVAPGQDTGKSISLKASKGDKADNNTDIAVGTSVAGILIILVVVIAVVGCRLYRRRRSGGNNREIPRNEEQKTQEILLQMPEADREEQT